MTDAPRRRTGQHRAPDDAPPTRPHGAAPASPRRIPDEPPEPAEANPRDPSRWLNILTVVITVALAAFLVVYVADQRAALDCQGQVNAEFREALQQRAQIAATERAAVKQLLTETLGTGTSSAQDRAALERYLAVSDQLATATPPISALERTC